MRKLTLFNNVLLKSFKILIIAVTVSSCGNKIGDEPDTKAGFSAIEQAIKSEFGDDAYFTDLTIIPDESIGNIINVTVTKDPSSLKMGEWVRSQDNWKQSAEITLEVPNGTKAVDYMFQLNDKINMAQLGALIEQSKKQLKAEKNLDNPKVDIASIDFPDNGDVAKTEYMINLKPENGGTTFRFSYDIDGNLIKMDY